MENNEQKDPQEGQSPTPLPAPPVLNPEAFTNQQLAKFEYNEEYLNKLIDKYKDLKIIGVDDKDGLKAVHDARIDLRDHRTTITKTGKNLREFANVYNKAILNRVSDLTSITIPREEELQAMEDEITAEKERLRQIKEREESAKIDVRLKELAAVGYAVDFHELKGMSDDHYAQVLDDATSEFNRKKEEAAIMERERKAEEERVKAEQEAERQRIDAEFKAEQKRIQAERDQQEKERAELERLRLENEAQAKKLREEQERIDAEKKKVQEQKNEARAARLMTSAFGIGYDPSRKVFSWAAPDGEDKIVLDYDLTMLLDDEEFEAVKDGAHVHVQSAMEKYNQRLAARKKAEEERIQRERDEAVAKAQKEAEEKRLKAEVEEKERLAQGEDCDRFVHVEKQVNALLNSEVWAQMTSKKGIEASTEAITLLAKARQVCRDNSVTPPA